MKTTLEKTLENYDNHLSASPTKWSNTLKQFVSKLLTNYCLSVFANFVGLALKGLIPTFEEFFIPTTTWTK